MVSVEEISKEHKQILRTIGVIEGFIQLEDSIDKKELKSALKKFKTFWDAHEKKEEGLFSKIASYDFRDEKMLLEQHKQLRGHWKVMTDALKKGTEEPRVTLDTDGRMLFDKFREHIRQEEDFFKKSKIIG